MTATEALECRIDELCRENEQLRQQVASIIGRSFRTADKMDCLATENAKLRELVRALLTCATEGECDECRMNGATPWHVGKAQLCDGVWEHLRELGIEVDG